LEREIYLMDMHRWHALWKLCECCVWVYLLQLCWFILLVQVFKVAYAFINKWITNQLLSTNEQSNYPSGSSLSGYVVYNAHLVVHIWCFGILNLPAPYSHHICIFLYCLYLCNLIGPRHNMKFWLGTTGGTITHKLDILPHA